MAEKNSDDLIFSEIKERVADQIQSAQSLDTKAALTLTFVGAIIAGLVNSQWFVGLGYGYHILILLSLVVTGLLALWAVLARGYRYDPEPNALIKGYAGKSESATKGQLIANYQSTFNENRGIIKKKSQILNGAFLALAVAIIILAVSIFFSLHKVSVR